MFVTSRSKEESHPVMCSLYTGSIGEEVAF